MLEVRSRLARDCTEAEIGMAGWLGKLSVLNCAPVPPRFKYMKSVKTENRPYCASAATIVAKFRFDTRSPKPIDVVADTVPPSAGGRLKFRFACTLGIHKY